eukprot:2437989-Pyramimonas_sp.AAC.2
MHSLEVHRFECDTTQLFNRAPRRNRELAREWLKRGQDEGVSSDCLSSEHGGRALIPRLRVKGRTALQPADRGPPRGLGEGVGGAGGSGPSGGGAAARGGDRGCCAGGGSEKVRKSVPFSPLPLSLVKSQSGPACASCKSLCVAFLNRR